MAQLILAPVTAAAASTPIIVRTERHCTGIAVGLAGAEVAALQISPDNGATWIAVLPVATNDLTVAAPSRSLVQPGLYRYSKGLTVGATSVYVATEDNA